MTVAKLVQNPPQGSGLVPMLVDEHYEDLVRGKPGRMIAAQVLLQPVGTSQRRTKEGVHRTVTYELVRLEPVRDAHEADNVAWEITRSYELRTTPQGRQTELPLVNSPSEQREKLIEACFEWASENDVSQTDLDARFTDQFGGKEYGHAETVRAGGLIQLMEFARYIGAVDDPIVGKNDEPADDSEPADPDEDLDTPSVASDEDTEFAAALPGSQTFSDPEPAPPTKRASKAVAAPPFEPPTA